jgi:hypothetical protein
LHRILGLRGPSESAGWLADKTWYRDFEQRLFRKLAELPLVRTKASRLIPAANAVFPITDDRLPWRATFDLALPLYGDTLPDALIIEECSALCGGWTSFFNQDDLLMKSCLLGAARLLGRVKQAETLEKLSSLLVVDIGSALEWLNRFILSVPEDRRRTSFDGLLPDQTKAHVFRPLDKLARDNGIDDGLKDVLEGLGEDIRERLLHQGVVAADKLLTTVAEEHSLVTAAKDLMKTRGTSIPASGDSGFRTSCLSLFAWLSRRSRWNDLKDSLPVLALDRDGNEALTRSPSEKHCACFREIV